MSEPRDRVRLFLGVEISLQAVHDLTAVAEALRRRARAGGPRVRWVAPETYHVTLKFLGWTPPEAIAAIRDALAGPVAGQGSFDITGRGLGAFPRPDRARVLWAGVDDPSGGLPRLAGMVEDGLEHLGFAREQRPFHAHVTLGRVRDQEDVSELLETSSEQVFRKTSIAAVTLFESVLKSTGSEYRMRARFALGTAPRGLERQTDSLKPGSITGSGELAGPAAAAPAPAQHTHEPHSEDHDPPAGAGTDASGRGDRA